MVLCPLPSIREFPFFFPSNTAVENRHRILGSSCTLPMIMWIFWSILFLVRQRHRRSQSTSQYVFEVPFRSSQFQVSCDWHLTVPLRAYLLALNSNPSQKLMFNILCFNIKIELSVLVSNVLIHKLTLKLLLPMVIRHGAKQLSRYNKWLVFLIYTHEPQILHRLIYWYSLQAFNLIFSLNIWKWVPHGSPHGRQ